MKRSSSRSRCCTRSRARCPRNPNLEKCTRKSVAALSAQASDASCFSCRTLNASNSINRDATFNISDTRSPYFGTPVGGTPINRGPSGSNTTAETTAARTEADRKKPLSRSNSRSITASRSASRSTAASSSAGKGTSAGPSADSSLADAQSGKLCHCHLKAPRSFSEQQGLALFSFVQYIAVAIIEAAASINYSKLFTTVCNLFKSCMMIVSQFVSSVRDRFRTAAPDSCPSPPSYSPATRCDPQTSSWTARPHQSSQYLPRLKPNCAVWTSTLETCCKPTTSYLSCHSVRSSARLEIPPSQWRFKTNSDESFDALANFKKRASHALETYRKSGLEILEGYKLQAEANYETCVQQVNSALTVLEKARYRSPKEQHNSQV